MGRSATNFPSAVTVPAPLIANTAGLADPCRVSETVAFWAPAAFEPSEMPAMPPTLAFRVRPVPSSIPASSEIDDFVASKNGAAVERFRPNRPAAVPAIVILRSPVPETVMGVPSPSDSASRSTAAVKPA